MVANAFWGQRVSVRGEMTSYNTEYGRIWEVISRVYAVSKQIGRAYI